MSFPLLPALALVIYNLIQLTLNVNNLTAAKALDNVLKHTVNKLNVINALQKENDAVAVYVGRNNSYCELSTIQNIAHIILEIRFSILKYMYVKNSTGTNGSEILGTLDEFYQQTDQSLSKLSTWPKTTSEVAFQSKAEFQLTLDRHRQDIRVSHDAVLSQIDFYTWTEKLFLDWLFQVYYYAV